MVVLCSSLLCDILLAHPFGPALYWLVLLPFHRVCHCELHHQLQAGAFSSESMHLGWLLVTIGVATAFPPALQRAKAVMLAALAFYVAFFNWRANLDLSSPLIVGTKLLEWCCGW